MKGTSGPSRVKILSDQFVSQRILNLERQHSFRKSQLLRTERSVANGSASCAPSCFCRAFVRLRTCFTL